MDIFAIITFVSMAIFFVVGNYAGSRVKNLDDYFVAGRRAPTLLILGTLVASVFSSAIFMGEAGFTYDTQMGAYMLFPSIAVIGYVYGALFFGRYLRRSRAPTVADYFGQRFNSRRVQQAAGVIIIVALGIYLLVVTQGAAFLLSDLTGFSYTQSLIIAWFTYTIFTMYSGSKGVILTDTLMFLMFTFATVFFVAVVVDNLGGVAAAIQSIAAIDSKPQLASWHGMIGPDTGWPTALDYVIWAVTIDLAWSVVYAVGPWQASRHLMARNEHVVIRAALYACIIVIFFQILVYGAGGLINLHKDDISPSETVMIWAARNLVPEYLGAFLLAGIMAAALSSASTFLSLVGFSASNDVLPKGRTLSLKSTRILMLVLGIIVLGACFIFPPNIFWLMLFVGTVFASSWGPVGLMSVWSKNITESAAFWGMTLGFVFNVGPALLEYREIVDLPEYFSPTIIGLIASFSAIFYCNHKHAVTKEETEFRTKLHITPEVDRDHKKTLVTMIPPALLVIYGMVMPFVMLNFYVIPYQTGTGQLLADGSVNWQTGEAIIIWASAFIYIPLGSFAAWFIWRSYSPKAKKNTN